MAKQDFVKDSLETLGLVFIPEGPDNKQDCANIAQVYALLAIVQELRRLNDKLDSFTDGGPRYPGVRTYTTVGQ